MPHVAISVLRQAVRVAVFAFYPWVESAEQGTRGEEKLGMAGEEHSALGVRGMVVWIVLFFLLYIFMLRTSDLATEEIRGSHKICRLPRGDVLCLRDGQSRREVQTTGGGPMQACMRVTALIKTVQGLVIEERRGPWVCGELYHKRGQRVGGGNPLMLYWGAGGRGRE